MTPEKIDDNETIIRFDSITTSAVYTGGLTQLVNVTNRIDWHEEFREDLFMEIGTITLKEIAEQLTVGKAKAPLITVIVNNPRGTDVYQYGNYNDNSWYRLGNLCGY